MTLSELLFSFADTADPTSLASRYRAVRFSSFLRLLEELPAQPRVLDVGGTPDVWLVNSARLPSGTSVTVLNREGMYAPPGEGIRCVIGDARNLSLFSDREFDICYSNSLLEHFATRAEQFRVASEIRRVAKCYFVQTPNKYFPMEPHFLVPGWQFLPPAWRSWLIQRRSWGWMKREVDEVSAREVVDSIRLLSRCEVSSLFPDGTFLRERFGPLTKSLIMYRVG